MVSSRLRIDRRRHFIFLTLLLLPDHAALYLEILKALGIFGAGAAGGYGLRAYQDRRPGSPRDS